MFKVAITKKFKKQRKKLHDKDKELVDEIILKLSKNEILDKNHCDHQLKGNLGDYRECHVKPDLLLVYKKDYDVIVLTCVSVGSHSSLF